MLVSVEDMMAARDRRLERQRRLRAAHGGTLVCFTMNIAGPVKMSGDIARAGERGFGRLTEWFALLRLPVLAVEAYREATGFEGYAAVGAPPEAVKRLAVCLEEFDALGRLYDVDVWTQEGRQLSRRDLGMEERRCLICGEEAHACARSRRHTVEDLQKKTADLLARGLRSSPCRQAGEWAVRALLEEVAVTPKPGLVDRRNTGSHADMDIFLFWRSACALQPYFEQAFSLGRQARETDGLFDHLRLAGQAAERAMLAATHGVNTHKGAVFSMGLLCCALGYLKGQADVPRLLDTVRRLAYGLCARDFGKSLAPRTAGERLFALLGDGGARAQAENGYPLLASMALPLLKRLLAQGLSLEAAGAQVLVHLMARMVDTNVFARGGMEAVREVMAQARAMADEAQRQNALIDEKILMDFDDALIKKRLSPGGCADMLALTYFCYFACCEREGEDAHGH